MPMTCHQRTLDNGLQILIEQNPQAQSTAVGFFVRTGARDESPQLAGVSHFLEHMAFKGNEQYSAADVNRIFDEVGASYNASTSEEVTLYYAAILPEYLERTFELLAAMMRPSLRESDFEMEKQVILEEIGMYEDMPAYSLYEKAMSLHFAGHPLGQSVLGSTASVSALTPEQMRAYHRSRYGASNLVLAAAGNVDVDELLGLVARHCDSWQPGTPGRTLSVPQLAPHVCWHYRETMNQEHVIQMGAAPAAQSPLRYAAEMAAVILGEDGVGRFYWELVETGHAESADLSYNEYDGTGAWATYLCCDPAATAFNLERIEAICAEFNRLGPTAEEFGQARNKVASRLVLASERPMGRLASLGSHWIYGHEYRSVSDELDALNRLTLHDFQALLQEYPVQQCTTSGLGPLAELN